MPSMNIQGPKYSDKGRTDTIIDPRSVGRGEVFSDALKLDVAHKVSRVFERLFIRQPPTPEENE